MTIKLETSSHNLRKQQQKQQKSNVLVSNFMKSCRGCKSLYYGNVIPALSGVFNPF